MAGACPSHLPGECGTSGRLPIRCALSTTSERQGVWPINTPKSRADKAPSSRADRRVTRTKVRRSPGPMAGTGDETRPACCAAGPQGGRTATASLEEDCLESHERCRDAHVCPDQAARWLDAGGPGTAAKCECAAEWSAWSGGRGPCAALRAAAPRCSVKRSTARIAGGKPQGRLRPQADERRSGIARGTAPAGSAARPASAEGKCEPHERRLGALDRHCGRFRGRARPATMVDAHGVPTPTRIGR